MVLSAAAWRLPVRISHGQRFSRALSSVVGSPALPTLAAGSPTAIYKQRVQNNLVQEDATQLEVLRLFDNLYNELVQREERRKAKGEAKKEENSHGEDAALGWFSALFSSKGSSEPPSESGSVASIRSLYLYGDTGCGKTYLMD
eukprot:gene34969-42347_t